MVADPHAEADATTMLPLSAKDLLSRSAATEVANTLALAKVGAAETTTSPGATAPDLATATLVGPAAGLESARMDVPAARENAIIENELDGVEEVSLPPLRHAPGYLLTHPQT